LLVHLALGAVPAVGGLVGKAVGLAVLILYVYSIFWAYGDAERRGKPGIIIALMVALLAWPIGLLVWIAFRPEGRYRR
jgi:hypothetical protein